MTIKYYVYKDKVKTIDVLKSTALKLQRIEFDHGLYETEYQANEYIKKLHRANKLMGVQSAKNGNYFSKYLKHYE